MITGIVCSEYNEYQWVERMGVVSVRMKVVLGVSMGGGICGPLVYS